MTGWPEVTLSRGEVVVENGELRAAPGRGRFLEQEISAAWRRARPAPPPAWMRD